MMELLGDNIYDNDYNQTSYNSGLNAFIGKTANGTVTAIQTMPWNYKPWGCGSGWRGSCNDGWIQFEICEDNLKDEEYFNLVYKEACELTAYLCKMFKIDPKGTVNYNGAIIPTILCHADSYTLGMGNNHGDVYNWFDIYGKTMADVRNDVFSLLQEAETEEEKPKEEVKTEEIKEIITDFNQEKFNEMMNNWIAATAIKEPSDWSKEARDWAEEKKIILGDENGNKKYKNYLTREEMVVILERVLNRPII